MLPHFTSYNPKTYNPIYKKLVDFYIDSETIDSETNNFLCYNIVEFKNDILYVNINDSSLHIIDKILFYCKNKDKFLLKIERHDKEGKNILCHLLEECNFIGIINLYDFSYSSDELMTLNIKINITSKQTFTNEKVYHRYLKYKKLRLL